MLADCFIRMSDCVISEVVGLYQSNFLSLMQAIYRAVAAIATEGQSDYLFFREVSLCSYIETRGLPTVFKSRTPF